MRAVFRSDDKPGSRYTLTVCVWGEGRSAGRVLSRNAGHGSGRSHAGRAGWGRTRPWRTVSDVEYATVSWAERHNNRHPHFWVGIISPTGFASAHYVDADSPAD